MSPHRGFFVRIKLHIEIVNLKPVTPTTILLPFYRVKLDCVPTRRILLALFRDQLYFSATKQRPTKSFGTHVHNTSNNTFTKLQLQRIKLHIEIVNLKPVTPTTILLQRRGAGFDFVKRCNFLSFGAFFSPISNAHIFNGR